MPAPTATPADDDELGASERTIARGALHHRQFRQSQHLRQDKVRALRAIIADDGADDAPADSAMNNNSGNIDRVGGGTTGGPLPAGQELGTRMSSVATRTTTALLSETKEAEEEEDNRGHAQDENEVLVHIPDDSVRAAATAQSGTPVSAAGATLAAEGATRRASGVAGDHGSRNDGDDIGASQANDHTTTIELNQYLWRLEEQRHPLGACDTSGPPTGDNQGEAGKNDQQQGWASRDATTKVLSARDVMDRRNLLEYAATLGKASHFEDLARWLRWKLGVGGLVSQLREPGVDGTPMLFQAVNIDECFKAVTKVLLDTLGAGGVAQQIRATDKKGMTLLMHVTRFAGSVEVLSSALELVKALTSRQQGLCHLRARDAQGRTLVHHAAEGRTEEMLPKVMELISKADLWVIDESDSESSNLRQYLSTRTDRHGRSPALCALGRKGTPRASLEKSIGVLLAGAPATLVNDDADDAHAAEGHLLTSPASPALSRRLRLMFQAPEGGGGKGARGNSPLCWVLHAARGGIEAFNLAYEGIRGQEEEANERSGLDLVRALGFGFPSSPPLTPEEFDKRCTKLFAQAALGGDRAVLERVASGLCLGAVPSDKRERYWATKADYPLDASDFLRAAHQADRMSAEDYTKKHHGFVEDESVGVGAAIIPFASTTTAGSTGVVGEATDGAVKNDSADKGGKDKLKASLFALTILSGSKEAVRWAANFVRDNSSNADEAWNVLCGINGKHSNVSSLTYATAASSDKDDGVFEAVCQALQKAAIKKCNGVASHGESDDIAGASVHPREAADELFREELLLRVGPPTELSSSAADDTDKAGGGGDKKMEERPTPNADAASVRRHFTPLAGAVFCGNADMFTKVLSAYKEGAHGGSSTDRNNASSGGNSTTVGFPESEIIAQTAAVLAKPTYKNKETHEDSGPMVAYERGSGDDGIEPVPPEVRLLLRGCCGPEAMQEVVDVIRSEQFSKAVEEAEWFDSLSTAKQAAAEGTFDGLRALIEKGWNCHAHLATLIADIGDAEEQVIATVLCAVENSSNPFVTSAIASVCIAKRGRDWSKDRSGLARLQREIDQFTTELLGKLPQTVKGVGLELMSSFEQPGLGKNDEADREEERATEDELAQRKNIMGNHVGYIAVRWMLEPSLNSGPKDKQSWLMSKMISATLQDLDPLQQALTRGSAAHDFINAPLVLDYLELKWKCTTPNLDRRNPLDYTINEGFSTYHSGNGNISLHERGDEVGYACFELGGATAEVSLLRLLQGWDRAPTMVRRFKRKLLLHGFPHTTVLPGAQFLLAGLLGKPTEFFLVPFVRFLFETFSYLTMLGLYSSSVALQYSDVIPVDEILFYLFAAGLLFREILEFRDALPPSISSFSSVTSSPSADATSSDDGGGHGSPQPDSVAARAREEPSGVSQRRVTSGLRRYFSKDNWNILDTASIFCILLAFTFRIIAYIEDFNQAATTILGNTLIGQAFFIARFALAAIAPLLFARVLSLAQVDNTFGPMTQIIWNMLFHLARFSVFMLVVMVSFALAFHSLYSDPNCSEGDELFESYSTIRESLLDMFKAMLGDPNFDRFEAGRNLTCTGPSWEFDAGITLLTMYVVLQAILMLNLLIAVLSTVHDTVSENAITEFHLARSQFIQASAASVEGGRLPPPLNLLMAAILIVVDVFGEICHSAGKCLCCVYNGRCGGGKPLPVAASASAAAASGGAGGDARRRPVEEKGPGMIPARDVGPVVPDAAEGFTAPAAAPAFEASEDEVKGQGDPGVGGGGNGLVGTSSTASSSDVSRGGDDGLVPMTERPTVKRAVGGLERLLFAISMGPVALALSAVLWAISIPSLAGRISQWILTVAGKAPKGRSRPAGYFRKLCSGIFGLLGLVIGLFMALVLFVAAVVGSVLLWLRGLYGVIEWLMQPIKQDGSESDPYLVSLVGKGAILPGALCASKGGWQDAVRVVQASNYGPMAQRKRTIVGGPVPGHFDVGALLKMTTGWTLGHLSSLVRMKEEESRKEESMLREIDDERSRIEEAADAAETEYGRHGGNNSKGVSFHEN